MDDIHIPREILRAVDQGRVSRRTLDEIKNEHLLSCCPHCRAEAAAYEAERRSGATVAKRIVQVVSILLERLAISISREAGRAERDLRELLTLSPEERLQRVERARDRFRSALLVKWLIEESRRFLPGRAAEAFHLAELARRVANRNPQMRGYFDLYVLATAHMANARRAAGDLNAAGQLFALTRQVMAEQGTTDPEVVARVDDLMGSLRKDQRRFAEAEKLLRRAVMLFELIHARHETARVLINLGETYRAWGDPDRAIQTTQSALLLLGPKSDLTLRVAGHYNLILQLVQAGRFEEAAEMLEADEGLFRKVQQLWLQIRLGWLRGDIAAGRGELEAAERAYLETRDGFVALGIGYDAAMVSLDLAVLYLRQGRTADVRRVAEEMLPIFEAQDVHREALAALALFQDAALQDQLTVEKALEVTAYLRVARNEPGLCFGWKRG
jgi:tetratricopeptide (TPR) repeat protein